MEPFGLLDEKQLLKQAAFPIPPTELVGLAKAFLASPEQEDWFAEEFRFVGPVVGPFGKDEFLDSLASFALKEAFPNLSFNFHNFHVDPFEPNRVRFNVKFLGTNSGPFMGRSATGKRVESSVEAHSLSFNEKGEVTKMTGGYVMDKETGNTGGLGGVFGLLYAVGYVLPFPEAQPWTPSPLYDTLMKGNKLLQLVFKRVPDLRSGIQNVFTQLSR